MEKKKIYIVASVEIATNEECGFTANEVNDLFKKKLIELTLTNNNSNLVLSEVNSNKFEVIEEEKSIYIQQGITCYAECEEPLTDNEEWWDENCKVIYNFHYDGDIANIMYGNIERQTFSYMIENVAI